MSRRAGCARGAVVLALVLRAHGAQAQAPAPDGRAAAWGRAEQLAGQGRWAEAGKELEAALTEAARR